MDRKEVPFGRDTVMEWSNNPCLGPVVLELPEGAARCCDSRGLTVTVVEHVDGAKYVVVVTTALHDGELLGSLVSLNAAEARNLAASLLRSASQLEPAPQVN